MSDEELLARTHALLTTLNDASNVTAPAASGNIACFGDSWASGACSSLAEVVLVRQFASCAECRPVAAACCLLVLRLMEETARV